MHFDECIWFVFTTFHSVAFGECVLNSDGARVIGCIISFYGYFFQMLSFAVILLSQLGGAKKPTLLSAYADGRDPVAFVLAIRCYLKEKALLPRRMACISGGKLPLEIPTVTTTTPSTTKGEPYLGFSI